MMVLSRPKPVRLDLRVHPNSQGIGIQFDLPDLDYSLADGYPDLEATPGIPRDHKAAEKYTRRTKNILKRFYLLRR